MKSSLLYKGNQLIPWCFVLPSIPLCWRWRRSSLQLHGPPLFVAHCFSPHDVNAAQPELCAGISTLHAFALSFLHSSWILSSIFFPHIVYLIPTPLLNLHVCLPSSQKLPLMPLCCSLLLLCNTLGMCLLLDCSFLGTVFSINSVYLLRSGTIQLICVCVPSTVLGRYVGMNEMPILELLAGYFVPQSLLIP